MTIIIQQLQQYYRLLRQRRQSGFVKRVVVIYIVLLSVLIPLSQPRQQQKNFVLYHTKFKSLSSSLLLLSSRFRTLSYYITLNNDCQRRIKLQSYQQLLGFVNVPSNNQRNNRIIISTDSARNNKEVVINFLFGTANLKKKTKIGYYRIQKNNFFQALSDNYNDDEQVDYYYDITSTTSDNNQRIQRNYDGNDDSLRIVRNIDIDIDDDDDKQVDDNNFDRRTTSTNSIKRKQPPLDNNEYSKFDKSANNDVDDESQKEEKDEIVEEEEERKKQMRRHKYWVLLVDDEESIRMAVGDYLYDSGYQVTACSDSDATINVLSIASSLSGSTNDRRKRSSSSNNNNNNNNNNQRRKLPDIIILDIRMPGSTMNGIELLQWIRSTERNNPLLQTIPIIMLTAKGLTQDRIIGYKAGATGYLSKPFNPNELLSILDNTILRYEQMKYSTTVVPSTTTTAMDSASNPTASASASPIALLEMQNDIETIKELLLQQQQQQQDSIINVRTTDVYLTPTECEVLDYLGQGLTKQEIATARNVTSIQSISRILNNLYRKTNVTTRTELIRWALETGYILPNNNKNNNKNIRRKRKG